MDLKGDYDYYGDNCVKLCFRAIGKFLEPKQKYQKDCLILYNNLVTEMRKSVSQSLPLIKLGHSEASCSFLLSFSSAARLSNTGLI